MPHIDGPGLAIVIGKDMAERRSKGKNKIKEIFGGDLLEAIEKKDKIMIGTILLAAAKMAMDEEDN